MTLLDRAKWLVLGATAVVVTACFETTATAPPEIDGRSTTLPRLTATLANANVCDDGVALRKPNGTFLKWQTQRKRVRRDERVEGKAVRQYHTIQFDDTGLQTRDVSCVLAVDAGAMPFLRSYFKQSSSVLSDQPTVGGSFLASVSFPSGDGPECWQVDSALWLCEKNGNSMACFAEYAGPSQWHCYAFQGSVAGSPPPTSAPPGFNPTAGNIEYTPPNQGGGGGGYYTYYPPNPNECPPRQEVVGPEDTCVITPPPPPLPTLPPAEQISNLVYFDPYALLDVRCGDISNWEGLATMPFPQSVAMRLLTDPVLSTGWPSAMIQTLQSAKGPIVNMDYYAVTVPIANIPNGLSINGFLEHVRTNINSFVNPPTHFNYYPGLTGEEQRWKSSNPLGTVFSVTLDPILESGSVITTAYSPFRWTFSTVRTPADLTHPVSGNREFGAQDHGNGTATFYTKATDRISNDLKRIYDWNPLFDLNIFDNGAAVWVGFQHRLKAELGVSAVVEDPVVKKVNYVQLNKVLTGQAPASTLKCKQE